MITMAKKMEYHLPTQKEAIEHFLSDRRYRNFNTVGVGQDVYDAHNQSDHQVKRLARLQKVYDALPNFTGGVGNTLADVALPMLLDPLNLIGFGSGGAAARAAVAGAKGLTKSQLMRKELPLVLLAVLKAKQLLEVLPKVLLILEYNIEI